MSLIICRECGKEVSDLAYCCPNCGFPLKIYNPSNTTIPENNISNVPNAQKIKKKDSALSIIAVIFSCFALLNFVGAIIAIIDLCVNNKSERHLGSWASIIFFAIYLIYIFAK